MYKELTIANNNKPTKIERKTESNSLKNKYKPSMEKNAFYHLLSGKCKLMSYHFTPVKMVFLKKDRKN